jgi:hypothetical protein
MPRMSNKHYLHTHRQLAHFWHHDPGLFSALSPTEQWQLHDFFQLSKTLSPEDLLTHRQAITEKRPSLPQQAGRSLEKFYAKTAEAALQRQRAQPAAVAVAKRKAVRGERVITVRSVVNPEIDVDKLARALLSAAKEIEVRERHAKAHPSAEPAAKSHRPAGHRGSRRAGRKGSPARSK